MTGRAVAAGAKGISRARSITRAALRDEWDGLDRITRDIRPADIVTLSNALTGLAAILLAANQRLELASLLVFVGILLDGADGAVARMGYGNGPLGGFLDSLADVITFAIAPATILATTADLGPIWLIWAAAGFYMVCVVMRLARFEALRERAPRRYFSGMSSPGGALAVIAILLVGAPTWLVVSLVFFTGGLMVSRVRYPKLRGPLGATAVVVIGAVLGTWSNPAWHEWAVLGLIAFMAFYLLAGPYYVLVRFGPTPDPRA